MNTRRCRAGSALLRKNGHACYGRRAGWFTARPHAGATGGVTPAHHAMIRARPIIFNSRRVMPVTQFVVVKSSYVLDLSANRRWGKPPTAELTERNCAHVLSRSPSRCRRLARRNDQSPFTLGITSKTCWRAQRRQRWVYMIFCTISNDHQSSPVPQPLSCAICAKNRKKNLNDNWFREPFKVSIGGSKWSTSSRSTSRSVGVSALELFVLMETLERYVVFAPGSTWFLRTSFPCCARVIYKYSIAICVCIVCIVPTELTAGCENV